MGKSFLTIAMVITFICSNSMSTHGMAGKIMAYFESPEQAVERIKIMLLEEQWEKLAAFYDMTDVDDIDEKSLSSGEFFIRKQRPEAAHPGEFWKYKLPFSPQFDYQSHHFLNSEFIEVTVEIEIDQGGGMIQRGIENFYLKKSTNGYQILPKTPSIESFKGASDILPVSIQPPPPSDNKPDWKK